MIKYHVFSMGNASDRTMPKKAYAKCVANETVSHKKLVKKVTEHLRFFPHGMMEAVLEAGAQNAEKKRHCTGFRERRRACFAITA